MSQWKRYRVRAIAALAVVGIVTGGALTPAHAATYEPIDGSGREPVSQAAVRASDSRRMWVPPSMLWACRPLSRAAAAR